MDNSGLRIQGILPGLGFEPAQPIEWQFWDVEIPWMLTQGFRRATHTTKTSCVNTNHINLKENNVYNVRNSCFDRDTCSDHVNSLRQKEPAGLLDLWCGKYCYKIY